MKKLFLYKSLLMIICLLGAAACGDGKKKEEALQMGKIFMKMIKGDASEEEIDSLEEASALRDIAHMPARVKCAVLGWRTLKEALLGEDADDDDDEDDE